MCCCCCSLSVERAGASMVPGLATMSERRFNTQCASNTCTLHSMPLIARPTSTPSQLDCVFKGSRPSKLPRVLEHLTKLKLYSPSKLVLFDSACIVNHELCRLNTTLTSIRSQRSVLMDTAPAGSGFGGLAEESWAVSWSFQT
jgi:hypothetical protein